MNQYIVLWRNGLASERDSYIHAISAQEAVDKVRKNAEFAIIISVHLLTDMKGNWK